MKERSKPSVVIVNDGDVAVNVPLSLKAVRMLHRSAWTERRSATMTKEDFRKTRPPMEGAEEAIANLLQALKISKAEFNGVLQAARTNPKERLHLWSVIVANRKRVLLGRETLD